MLRTVGSDKKNDFVISSQKKLENAIFKNGGVDWEYFKKCKKNITESLSKYE